MKKKSAMVAGGIIVITVMGLAVGVAVVPKALLASSHREAPITALDHAADITDLYAFRSYDPNLTTPKVTMILCVDPFLDPANGPNWFPFDPNIVYEIEIDNNHDAVEDIVFQFRFATQFQLPTVYAGLAGVGPNGANAPGTSTLVVPPQINDFSNPGLNLRQTYTLTMIKNGVASQITNSDGSPFFALPANAGPRTMNYAALYKAGTYTNLNPTGISVFAGTVDDPFFIDLGAAFDTGNFRAGASGIPGVLASSDDTANANFASDTVSGFAVNAIAIEVPVEMLTSTGKIEPATSTAATIGIWGSTLRPRITIRRSPLAERNLPNINNVTASSRAFRQVQRMGNPLINELIIGIGSKDRWSMDEPKNDVQFASFDLDPPFVHIVDALYGAAFPGVLFEPPPPRNDLLPLVIYAPPICPSCGANDRGPIADLIRLNTGIDPTPAASQKRLGFITGDNAGFPNGRRLADDVVDIALRVVVGGVLAGSKCGPTHTSACNVFPNNALGDGVNVNDVNENLATDGVTNLVEPNTHFHTSFPYVDYCPSGRGRIHIDPGDPGCTGGTGPNCVP